MLTTKYISVKQIMGRILRNPLMEGITESDVINYIADVIALIGAPMAYHDKVDTIEVCNYRAELPCDILYIQQTRKRESNGQLRPMRYSSDTFQSAYHEVGSPDFFSKASNYDFPYSINNGMIYTSFSDGTIEMSYKALPTDEEGFPLIPDNAKFIRAVEEYIKAQWFRIQWSLGKISKQVYDDAEQQYCWYVGAANTAAQLMSIDQAETFRAAFTRHLSNVTAAKKSFSDFGQQEYIKVGSI
jgi:hypothetical protein